MIWITRCNCTVVKILGKGWEQVWDHGITNDRVIVNVCVKAAGQCPEASNAK